MHSAGKRERRGENTFQTACTLLRMYRGVHTVCTGSDLKPGSTVTTHRHSPKAPGDQVEVADSKPSKAALYYVTPSHCPSVSDSRLPTTEVTAIYTYCVQPHTECPAWHEWELGKGRAEQINECRRALVALLAQKHETTAGATLLWTVHAASLPCPSPLHSSGPGILPSSASPQGPPHRHQRGPLLWLLHPSSYTTLQESSVPVSDPPKPPVAGTFYLQCPGHHCRSWRSRRTPSKSATTAPAQNSPIPLK